MTISRSSASGFFRLAAIAAVLACAHPAHASPALDPLGPARMGGHAANASLTGAHFINPAFADDSAAPFIAYRLLRHEGGGGSDHLASVSMAGLALSYLRVDRPYDPATGDFYGPHMDIAGITKGFFFGNVFGIGASYSFAVGAGDGHGRYRSFTAGALLRPARFVSLGYVARDLNEPRADGRKVPAHEVCSVSVRPFGDVLSLSCDAERRYGRRFDRDGLFFSAELRLPYDIRVFAGARPSGDISAGALVPLGFGGAAGSTLVFDYFNIAGTHGSPRTSAYGVGFTRARYRSAFTPASGVLVIRFAERMNEIEEERMLGERPPSFHDMIAALGEAAADPSVSAVLLVIDAMPLGFAQVQEARAAVKRFRASGKRVCAALASVGNREYYLAAAADEVCMAPNSPFAITGLVAEVYFFKGLMDKVGVRFESISKGKYKSFSEPFTREGMSEAHRENLTQLLSDLNRQFLDDVGRDRRLTRSEIDALFERGFLEPEEARAARFIDTIAYPDELEKRLTGGADRAVKLEEYIARRRRIEEWGPAPVIAVVHVSGSIVRGEERRSGLLGPNAIGDRAFREALERAFSSSSVRAVVIRVNSGGGSATASDFMWRALLEMKEKYGKPVVFSFGNIAASGGYYIACTGDKIFGGEGTITGSIGVVMGKLDLGGLYARLGINKDIIKMSEFADIFDESRKLSPRERELLRKAVDFTYRGFVDKVVRGRSIPPEEMPSIAEGRVFSGSRAKERALVDSIGGLAAAIEYAKSAAGIDGSFRVIHLPERKSSIVEMLGSASADEALAALEPIRGALQGLYHGGESWLFLYPYRIEIK